MTDQENWNEFYALTQKLCRKKPWTVYDDGQLFCLLYDDEKEPVYINILGISKQVYGLVFYEGDSGLNDYNLLRTAEDLGLQDYYSLFQQNAYTIYFTFDDEEIPDEQLHFYEQSGADFSDSEYGVPFVLSLKKGYMPWGIEPGAIGMINSWLKLFFGVLPYAQPDDSWGIGRPEEYMLCDVRQDEDNWVFSSPALPSDSYIPPEAHLPEEEISAALKGAKRSRSEYQADIWYGNFHVSDPKFYRPASAAVILVADSHSGMILGQKICEPNESLPDEFGRILLGTFRNYGIPREIQVRSPVFSAMLEEIADEAGVKFRITDDLDKTDAAVSLLSAVMEGGEEPLFS